MTDDVRKLLGGYATGTLTEDERQQLFSAALEDQELFEALADEEALRELLQDSAARAKLLQATETAHFSIKTALSEWFSRPKAKILAGLGCAALVAVAVQSYRERPPVQIARNERPALVMPLPQPAPPPASAEEKPKEQKIARREAPAKLAPARQAAPPPPPPAPAPAPEMAAVKTTPPPPPRETADSEAATVATAPQFRFTLLRRDENGSDVAVPPTYEFAASDRVRLRIEPIQEGMLQVRGNRNTILFAGAVSAGSPVVIPRELTFTEDATQTIDIRFGPMIGPHSVSVTAFRAMTARQPEMSSQSSPVSSAQIVLHRKKD